jgi:hypothetical protein
MARSNAQAWWADVEDLRDSIEARRAAGEQRARGTAQGARRTISITGHPAGHARPVARLTDADEPPSTLARTRRRPPLRVTDRLGPRPDRIAAWAVLLGFAIVLATILTTHG